MTVKALLFDLGNTFAYQNPCKTIQKTLETHGVIRTTEETIEDKREGINL